MFVYQHILPKIKNPDPIFLLQRDIASTKLVRKLTGYEAYQPSAKAQIKHKRSVQKGKTKQKAKYVKVIYPVYEKLKSTFTEGISRTKKNKAIYAELSKTMQEPPDLKTIDRRVKKIEE